MTHKFSMVFFSFVRFHIALFFFFFTNYKFIATLHLFLLSVIPLYGLTIIISGMEYGVVMAGYQQCNEGSWEVQRSSYFS